MIKLKDLLFEASETPFRPQDYYKNNNSRYYYTILKNFTAKHLTGNWKKTNMYYGNSQVSKMTSEPMMVKKGWVVANIPGGMFALDTQKKKAWELDWKSLRQVDPKDIEQITDDGKISKMRWKIFKNWEPYKTSFDTAQAKRDARRNR